MALAICMFSLGANAADNRVLGTVVRGGSTVTTVIDLERVTVVGTKRQFLLMALYSPPIEASAIGLDDVEGRFAMIGYKVELDCPEQKYRDLEIWLMKEDKEIAMGQVDGAWRPLEPTSIVEGAAKLACSKG